MPQVRRWPLVGGGLLAVALLLGFVAADTAWLQPHGLAVDEAIAAGARTSLGTIVMLNVSRIFSPLAGVLILVAWTGLLVFWRHRPVAAVSTFSVVAAGWSSALVVKAIVGRDRPPSALVHSLSSETGPTSYPSGHVALAFSIVAAAWFLARGTRWSRLVATCGVLVVAVVGFSRLYIGVHYPGDVVGSVLVSSSAIVVLTGLWHRVIVRRIGSGPILAPFVSRFSSVTERADEPRVADAA